MTPDQAISKLRELPEDKQRAVLMQLSPDERKGILGKLGPSQPPPPAPPATPSLMDTLTTPREHNLKSLLPGKNGQYDIGAYGNEISTAAHNFSGAAIDALAHPVRTVGGILRSAAETVPGVSVAENLMGKKSSAEEMGQQFVKAPLETIEAALGQGAAVGLATEGTIGALKSIPKVAGRVTEAVTKTGPRETRNLVKDIQKANEAEVAKTAEKNEAQDAKRRVDLTKHFEKTQATKEANAAEEAPVARKAALTRGVEQLDPKFQDDLTALRGKVNEQANAKYKALNAALDPEEANPDFLPDALSAAMDKIKGSDTEPTILKDMSKKTQQGDVLTYRDLQGYYSELGRELQKGTLPGDVYYAYNTLQEAIGDEMQNVANRKGMGPQLQDARATWRQMKETFYDPKSPLTKALKAGERGKSIAALSGADQTGVEALAKYDPSLARRANTIRGYQAEAKSIPSKPKPLKSLPKLETKPAPIQPEVQKIAPAEIRQKKTESLADRTNSIRTKGGNWANTFVILDAIRNAIHLNAGAIGTDIAVRGIFGAGKQGIANLLERPEVVRFLTKPTERDLAEVPPDLRADLSQVAQIAAKKGIKVDPRLYAAVGVHPKKRVAAALTQ